MPRRPPPAQTSLFGTPAPQPAPPSLPRWWRVPVSDIPATEDGLAQLSELLADLLARDLRLLVAIEEHSELHRGLAEGTIEHERANRVHRHLVLQLAARVELEEAERRGELVEIDLGPSLIWEE